MPINLTDANFNEYLQGRGPILVDFWAEWCGPCKMLGKVLDEVAPAYEGKVEVVKVDIDANPEAAAAFGVRAIPTLVLIGTDGSREAKVGAMRPSVLKSWLDHAA